MYSNVLKLLFFFRIISHFYLGPSVSNVLENANHKKPILFVILCPLFVSFPILGDKHCFPISDIQCRSHFRYKLSVTRRSFISRVNCVYAGNELQRYHFYSSKRHIGTFSHAHMSALPGDVTSLATECYALRSLDSTRLRS